jgi:hypothetical protein
MKARQMIEGASFGPEALKDIGEAFDEAWASTAGNFSEGVATETARIQLAEAVLSAATDEIHDTCALKQAALQIMKSKYRQL